ncbi:MAG: ribulose-phosphate 3-epimerase [Deltaproteobacteria bacterium]|nr:ribulose-phosphate 3-epimerase [Deltaproteobacteria bacterium]
MREAVRVAPSILAADHARLGDEIRAVAKAGADLIHVDVMDGHFVKNLTLGPPVIKSLRKTTKVPFDVHLMIERPEESVAAYVDAGADRLTIQAEATAHLHRALAQIRELGAKPGVAINPATPLSSIVHVLHLVDLVLVMTVNPGFGGQTFIAEVMPKLRALKALAARRHLGFDLEVDGGIDSKTAAVAAAHGANVLVAGSAIFSQKSYGPIVKALRQRAAQARLVPAPLTDALV